MVRIRIRKYKGNPDLYEVVGFRKIVRTGSKRRAEEIADARRRLRAKGGKAKYRR